MIHRGLCRCGEVRFSVDGPPLLTAACHCIDCQRMTAGPYSLSALYPEDRFELLGGDSVLGECRSAGHHYFCDKCFSWTHSRPSGLDGMINVRTPLLEDAANFPPYAEFFRDEGLPGVASGAALTFGSAPLAEEFFKLKDSYAVWDGRPS